MYTVLHWHFTHDTCIPLVTASHTILLLTMELILRTEPSKVITDGTQQGFHLEYRSCCQPPMGTEGLRQSTSTSKVVCTGTSFLCRIEAYLVRIAHFLDNVVVMIGS